MWRKRVRIIKLRRQEKKMKILLLLVNMPSFGNKPLCTWIVLSGFISVIIIEKDEPIVIYTYTSRSQNAYCVCWTTANFYQYVTVNQFYAPLIDMYRYTDACKYGTKSIYIAFPRFNECSNGWKIYSTHTIHSNIKMYVASRFCVAPSHPQLINISLSSLIVVLPLFFDNVVKATMP